MQLMGGSSLLAKASTALQAAAAKADRAITELKVDLKVDFKADASKGADGPVPSLIDLEVDKNREGLFRQRSRPPRSSSTKSNPEVDKNEKGFRLRVLPSKQEKDIPSAVSLVEGEEELGAQDFWKRYISSLKSIKHDFLDRDSEVRVSDDAVWIADPTCTVDSPRKDPVEEEDYKKAYSVVSIPASFLLRKLAAAAENAKCAKAMKNALQKTRSTERDTLTTSGEWAALASGLVRRISQKDGKLRSASTKGSLHPFMYDLFEAHGQLPDLDAGMEFGSPPRKMRLPQEIHGAPPDSFVAKLAELMGGLNSEQKMAEFWVEVVSELRRRWFASEPIPRMPVDMSPDLRYCSVHQQLQLINCCIARRKRRASTLASLPEALARKCQTLGDAQSYCPTSDSMDTCALPMQEFGKSYARQKDGRLLVRQGADRPADDLRMLQTGERVYSPLTQESPVFTETSIREAEELVLRTGSMGAGCSHLLSDMQAFKAANPGCILEDFVRWYSPPDWREDSDCEVDMEDQAADGSAREEGGGNEGSLRGRLSIRMQSKDNLWQELWASSRAIPAVRQPPLFDEELAGESALDALENISSVDLFRQLFTAAFSVGYAIVEASEAAMQDPLRNCLQKCSDFIVYHCGDEMNGATLQQMCEAYTELEAATVLVPLEDASETQCRPWLSSLKGGFRVGDKS